MLNRHRDLSTIFFAKTVNLNVSHSSLFTSVIVRCGHDMPDRREETLKKNARQSENFLEYFCQVSFSNRLKVVSFI